MLAAVAAGGAAWAADNLPAKRIEGPNARFDLRVRVDGTTDFLLRGANVRYEVLQAATPRDAGSTFSEKLPSEPTSFEIEKVEGRGRLEVMEKPSDENDWTLRLRISDDEAGISFYHVQVSWPREGADAASGALGNEAAVRER